MGFDGVTHRLAACSRKDDLPTAYNGGGWIGGPIEFWARVQGRIKRRNMKVKNAMSKVFHLSAHLLNDLTQLFIRDFSGGIPGCRIAEADACHCMVIVDLH